MQTAPFTTSSEARATTSATTSSGALAATSPIRLLMLPAVLERVTISRSGWYIGIREGRYPAPVRLSPRRVAWRESDINRLIQQLAAE
ncbi:MAG: AlpA family phage regulatory protein [Burkholderiaceae bacterium]|nr:MAG: AlpA family phage regulatory protein [Burkholderiaceae bacterium]